MRSSLAARVIRSLWTPLVLSPTALIATTALCLWLEPHAQLEDLAMVHLLGIVLVAMRCSVPLSLATAALGVVSFDFFFIPPRHELVWADAKNSLTFGAMLIVALVVSVLNSRLRRTAHLAEAVRRSELEAEAERVRSSILSSISHDLKTPLASIIAAGTTLLDRRQKLSEAELRELLGAIVSQSERLERVIQNLLSVTRLESPTIDLRRSSEALDEIVAASLDRLESRLPVERVRTDIDPNLPAVSVEPLLIEQVLCNLLENAARYSHNDSPIELTARSEGDYVRVAVADHGPGVPVDQRERMFEKFQRGAASRSDDGGLGLGLTICRAIVRAHGGDIEIRERAGGGALVRFTLPTASYPQIWDGVSLGVAS